MTLMPVQMQKGFNHKLGIELVEWTKDGMLGRLELTPDLLNSNGIAHGGIYCTLLDFGCGLAGSYAPPGAPRKFCVTLTLTTNFIASVSAGMLHVRARRVGGGSKVYFAEAEITDDAGRRLATAVGTFRYITPRSGPATD